MFVPISSFSLASTKKDSSIMSKLPILPPPNISLIDLEYFELSLTPPIIGVV